VANFGWVSASPYLSFRLFEDLGEAYSPDLVVLCIDMTDFFEEILYRAMVERRGLYRLYDTMPITLNLLRTRAPGVFWAIYDRINHFIPDKRFFATEAPLEETREQMEPLVRSLSVIHEHANRLGADFVVFVLPRSYQYSAEECPDNIEKDLYTVLGPHSLEPFRFFEEIEDDLAFPVLSLLETFQETTVFPTCFNNDPHWNPAGHEVAARAIAEYLETRIPAAPEKP
jgi:hypothetical protein